MHIWGTMLVGLDLLTDWQDLDTPRRVQTAKGTLTLNTNGSFTYAPNSDFNGNDSVTYCLSDRVGGTDAATCTIVVHRHAETHVTRTP